MEEPVLGKPEITIKTSRIQSLFNRVKAHKLVSTFIILGLIALIIAGQFVGHKLSQNSKQHSYTNSINPKTTSTPNPDQNKQKLDCTAPSDDRYYRTDRSLSIDPQNPKHLFVAIEYKGAYQSFDGGNTWAQTLKDFKWYAGCFPEPFKAMISPIDSKTIYISTNGNGIVKTSDGGKTWKKTYASWQYGRSEDFEFDPSNAHTIYAASEDIKNAPNANDNSQTSKGIVYKSTDDGNTWTEQTTPYVEGTGNNGMVVSKTDPKHVLGFTLTVHFHPGGRQIDTSNQVGILETRDGGNTWTAIHTIPANYDATGFMAYAPLNTDHIYVTSFTAQGTPEIDYSSLDFGQTWRASDTVMSYVFYDANDTTGMHVYGINSQPNVNSANKFFESHDCGRSWAQTYNFPSEITNSGDHKTLISNMKWDPTNPSIIYASAASGYVWKSIDTGKTWAKILSYDNLPK